MKKHGLSLLLLLLRCNLLAAQGSVTDYAPQINVPCPDVETAPLLRVFTPETQSLHPQEAWYIEQRESTVIPAAWEGWLGDGSGIDYNLSAFVGHFPRIGVAFSGGGLRAAQYGAGVVSGIDARNASAKAAGTGGLLQVSSYIAGLSGAMCLGHGYMPSNCILIVLL
jgi:lysophospholipase